MENVIILAEWHNSSVNGGSFLVILFGVLLGLVFGFYMRCLLKDKESFTLFLILSVIFAFLLWPLLSDCIQHRGETFQRIAAPPQVTKQQLEEKYDTVDLSIETANCPEGMVCWQVSFKQVD